MIAGIFFFFLVFVLGLIPGAAGDESKSRSWSRAAAYLPQPAACLREVRL